MIKHIRTALTAALIALTIAFSAGTLDGFLPTAYEPRMCWPWVVAAPRAVVKFALEQHPSRCMFPWHLGQCSLPDQDAHIMTSGMAHSIFEIKQEVCTSCTNERGSHNGNRSNHRKCSRRRSKHAQHRRWR